MTTKWRDYCEARGACPRCGGIDTMRTTQENDYGFTTTCDRCNNEVYHYRRWRS